MDFSTADQVNSLQFKVGSDVIVRRGGRWPGKVISLGGSGAATFLTEGRLQVSYEFAQKKGRGFTRITQTAWVAPDALERRTLSPRKSPPSTEQAAPASADVSKPSSVAARPHSEKDGTAEGPTLASHERGRKLQQTGGSGGLLGKRKTPESNVDVTQRLQEFPNQSLIENKGGAGSGELSIFCRACKYGIRNHKGTISTHVNGPTHTKKLKAWRAKLSTQDDVKEFLSEYFRENPGEKLATEDAATLLWRFNVMETFLAAGLPPTKIDALAGLLKGHVPDSSNMKTFIPKVEKFEIKRLKKEIEGQKVTVIFDGTTRLGEAIAVLLRWCPDDFNGIQ
eukprot:2130345-Prymnesium_polylepis.2